MLSELWVKEHTVIAGVTAGPEGKSAPWRVRALRRGMSGYG